MRMLIRYCISTILVIISLGGFTQSGENTIVYADTTQLKLAIKEVLTEIEETDTTDVEKSKEILASALALGDTLTFFELSTHIIRYHFATKNINEEAIEFLKECQQMLGRDMHEIDDYNNALGNFYTRLSFYSEAVDHYHKSIIWFEKYDPKNVTIPLGNLGDIYYDNRNYEKALYYNELALERSLELENINERLENTTFDYYRIGSIYHRLGNDELAESYFNKSMQQAKAYDSTSVLMLLSITKTLVFYNDIEEKVKAKRLITMGERICASEENAGASVCINFRLQKNRFNLLNGDISQADLPSSFEKSTVTLDKEIFKYSIDYFRKTNNIDSIISNYDRLSEYQEQELVANRKIAFSNIEEKYRNKQLEERNKQLAEDIKKRQRMIFVIGGILLLLSSFLLLQYINNNRFKRLYNLLQAKTKDLEQSNQELEISNKELERFTFIVSHDLKTPVQNIISFTELLENELNISEDTKSKKYLDYIKFGGERLHNLIADTLEYSQMSMQGNVESNEVIDLDGIVDDIESSLKSKHKPKNVDILRPAQLPNIVSKNQSISILLQNLIDNGLTYNQSATPTVTLTTKKTKDHFSIFIQDNGIGIPEKYHEKIFDMFVRLHNQNVYKGSGLGLSISSKILDKLNGDLLLQSEEGKGSTFEIRLPASVLDVTSFQG